MKQKWSTLISSVKDMSEWEKWSIKWFITVIVFIIVSFLLLVRIAKWTGFELADWPSIMILIEVMVGVAIYAGIASRKTDASEKMKRQAIWACSIFVLVLAGLFILRIIDLIRVGEIIEIIVLFGLVLITAEYTRHTRIMAKEMKEQRYAALKPIIDIQKQIGSGLDSAREEMAALKGELPQALPCKLINIGPGPAIDVYSFIEYPIGKRSRWDFGTIAAGYESPSQAQLFLEPQGDRSFLVAYYKDVYNQRFKSSREVKINKEERRLDMAPLAICKLPKEEHNNND